MNWKNLLLGNEKALVGGITAGALSLLALVGVTGNMTVKEALYALGSWVVTHATVWLTSTTPKV